MTPGRRGRTGAGIRGSPAAARSCEGARCRREQAHHEDDGGFTSVEVIFAMVFMVVVSAMSLTAVQTVTFVSQRVLDQGQDNQVSSIALSELRDEIASANIVFPPTTDFNPTAALGGYDGTSGTDCATTASQSGGDGVNCAGKNPDGTAIPAGYSLRIYTQANGADDCIQWRLLDTGTLQVRQWSDPYDGTPWTTLMPGLVNYKDSSAPFVLDGNYANRLLDVDLLFSQHPGEPTIKVDSSIAGRNLWFDPTGYAADSGVCSPEPSP